MILQLARVPISGTTEEMLGAGVVAANWRVCGNQEEAACLLGINGVCARIARQHSWVSSNKK